jgi:hypothetical protein
MRSIECLWHWRKDMRVSPRVSIFVLLVAPCCFAQTPPQNSPVTILESSWQRSRHAQKKPDGSDVGPARGMTSDNKYYQRTARENQTKGAIDPNEYTIDGRSAALEKNVQEARTPKIDDITGYLYLANVRNDGGKKIEVIFWEYRFTELANPANVVRRQFLCSANIKPGEKKELVVFSQLGPSDVISAESLAKATDRLFDEKVFVNRIEYSDGTTVQRGAWKYDDFRKAIDRATSTPWGKEVCRGL